MLKVQKPHLDEHQDSDVLPVLYHQPYRKIIPSLCLFSITIPQAACFESLGVPSKFLSTFHQLGSNGAFGRDTHCDFWFGISLAMAGSPSHSRRCRLDQPLLSSWKVDMQSDTQKTNAQVGGQGPGVLWLTLAQVSPPVSWNHVDVHTDAYLEHTSKAHFFSRDLLSTSSTFEGSLCLVPLLFPISQLSKVVQGLHKRLVLWA